jgi:hypothetical protein
VKKRLPFFVFLGIGLALWRGGFGFLATERTLTWRFPQAYADVRRLELQVWDGDGLIKRQELVTPGGVTSEPTSKITLARGPHNAVGTLWLADAGQRTFQREFDPGMAEDVLISFDK